jgi:hypothetical protein
MVIYKNPSYYEISNAPLLASNATSKITDDNENCVLDMLYDNTLDDGPMLINNPPCLEVVTKLCKDKDDILAICSGTLTHESPTLFLNSPNYTLEEKFAYVEKYLCGLQLPCVENPHCLTILIMKIVLSTILKEESMLMNTMIIIMILFIKQTCNYYERGGDKIPHYATNNYRLQGDDVNIDWKTSIHSYTKFLCIERKLDFVVITFVLCFSLYQVLTSQLL